MSDTKLIKISTYLTENNEKKWKKACYLLDEKKLNVINKALDIGLDKILKELEEKK